jgi:hypothetical protein
MATSLRNSYQQKRVITVILSPDWSWLCLVGSGQTRTARRSGRIEDYPETRARRLLHDYLVADAWQKRKYYEAIAGAAAACRSDVLNPSMEDPQLAHSSAEAALKVVKLRDRLNNN